MFTTTVRKWHSYVALFIAPSVLFFSLTGAVQLFNLHEAHGGYRPPAIVEKLSSVHKDQVFAFGGHHVAGAGGGPPNDDERVAASTLMLKWFFLLVSLGLVLSTTLGIWMGLTQIRRTRLALVLLAAGTLIPVGLLLV
jgi:hypothetical protein